MPVKKIFLVTIVFAFLPAYGSLPQMVEEENHEVDDKEALAVRSLLYFDIRANRFKPTLFAVDAEEDILILANQKDYLGTKKSCKAFNIKTGAQIVHMTLDKRFRFLVAGNGRIFGHTREVVYELSVHKGTLKKLFSSDDLAAQCNSMPIGQRVSNLTLSKDGSMVAVAVGSCCACYDLKNTKLYVCRSQKKCEQGAKVTHLFFSDDVSRLIEIRSNGLIRGFASSKGGQVASIDAHKGSQIDAYCLVGDCLYTYSSNGILCKSSLPDNKVEQVYKLEEYTGIAFSPKADKLLLVGKDSGAIIFDLGTEKKMKLSRYGKVVDGCFHPDGKLLVLLDDSHALSLWDTEKGRECAKISLSKAYAGFEFIHQGNALIIKTDKGCRVWHYTNATLAQVLNLEKLDPPQIDLLKKIASDTSGKEWVGELLNSESLRATLASLGDVFVRTLFLGKIDFHTWGDDGKTEFHRALQWGKYSLAQFLLRMGAGKETPDDIQRRPLHWAAWGGDSDCVKLLTDNGASLEKEDKDGLRPVHWAARLGRDGALKVLLKKGAQTDVLDRYGWTPAHWAARNGHDGCLDLLLKKGAKRDLKDNEDKTPLDWARQNKHKKCQKLLK